MQVNIPEDLEVYSRQLAEQAVAGARQLVTLSGLQKQQVLQSMAEGLEQSADAIVQANANDLAAAEQHDVSAAFIGKLQIDHAGVQKMADAVRQIAAQVDPVGQVIEGYVRPNGLRLEKRRVPLGVVMVIYESRPNVTSDAAALCIQSGNAVILRGGKEAIHSNRAIARVICSALESAGVDPNIVQVVQTTDRAMVGHLLKMEDQISVVIPRGGESLIRAVVEQSRIPVIKHYTGNCHVYVDQFARHLPSGMVRDVVVNAKAQRPGVCNAAETVLFHRAVPELLVEACLGLAEAGVQMRCDERSLALLAGQVDAAKLRPAEEADWSTEFLDYVIAVKMVDTLDAAVAHINRYGSRHTDAILTADQFAADRFVLTVDSADVMVNCSTRWSDGGEYGLGAEIGISTDKLHARGPMGAADLTTYKWVVTGHGQIRS